MSLFDDLTHFPPDFCGTVRLFPLPDLVLFPSVILPLHVFEPRYRELLADTLATDRLIAMVLLKPGWQANYEGRPLLEPVACLGRIVAHSPEEGGKANILLAGLRRVKIGRELPADRPYRQARVEILEDDYPCSGAEHRPTVQRQLMREVRKLLAVRKGLRKQLGEILKAPIPLGRLTDILSFSLPWEISFRQQLLEETDVDVRAAAILDALDALPRPEPTAAIATPLFPPEFSAN